MYEYAAGDLRGNTTEMVRAKSPEAARAQCVALGVPEEHVETWAVRSEASEHAEEVRRFEGEVKRLEGAVGRFEAQASDLERELQGASDEAFAAERKRRALQVAIDTALDDLCRIQPAEFCALDATLLERAIKTLSDV